MNLCILINLKFVYSQVADEPTHVGEPPYAQPHKQKITQQPQPSNAEAGATEPQV